MVPNMTEEIFVKRCPVCCDNCNCKPCLRDLHPKLKMKFQFEPNGYQKAYGYIYTALLLMTNLSDDTY
nr:hypothetical protein [Tanacetum cinerariifolium]